MQKQEKKISTVTKDSATYGSMLHEVEKLVGQVSSGDVDLDTMIGQVERGFELIASMRSRLDDSKIKIENLREKYQASTETVTPS